MRRSTSRCWTCGAGAWRSPIERAGDVLRIASEHGYEIWTAIGLVLRGVTAAYLGDVDGGLAQVERGVGLYRNLRTPPVFWPQILGLRATTCALAGRSADALEMLDQAAELAAEGSWDSAALKIQKPTCSSSWATYRRRRRCCVGPSTRPNRAARS